MVSLFRFICLARSPVVRDIFHTPVARCSLLMLKMALYAD